MDIERLKELKGWVNDLRKFGVSEGNELITLIDESIARQSVKSEEVAEAIEYLQPLTEHPTMSGNFAKHIKTAITALQAYQPTTRKDRTVEEVAISKTETTSARALSCWYCTEIEKHGVVAVKTVLDKAGRNLDAYETPYNYCSNCGRKLTCPE